MHKIADESSFWQLGLHSDKTEFNLALFAGLKCWSIGRSSTFYRLTTQRHDWLIDWLTLKGFEKNFDSYGPDRVDSAEEPYDFDSLMHYDNRAFSKNGDDTLQSLSAPGRPLGNMDHFSTIDIKQLLKDYPCKPWDKKPVVDVVKKGERSENCK